MNEAIKRKFSRLSTVDGMLLEPVLREGGRESSPTGLACLNIVEEIILT